jgi:hypothetical protein
MLDEIPGRARQTWAELRNVYLHSFLALWGVDGVSGDFQQDVTDMTGTVVSTKGKCVLHVCFAHALSLNVCVVLPML